MQSNIQVSDVEFDEKGGTIKAVVSIEPPPTLEQVTEGEVTVHVRSCGNTAASCYDVYKSCPFVLRLTAGENGVFVFSALVPKTEGSSLGEPGGKYYRTSDKRVADVPEEIVKRAVQFALKRLYEEEMGRRKEEIERRLKDGAGLFAVKFLGMTGQEEVDKFVAYCIDIVTNKV